jgi:hypothetical protein
MAKRITKEDSYNIYIKALAGYTPQEIVTDFPDYHADQVRNHIKRKYPDVKNKLKKDISRGNIMLKALLDKLYPHDKVIQEYHIGKSLRLDCYIGAPHNIGFEYDGVQHSKKVEHFGGDESYARGIQNDMLKEELCAGRGINLVRISYDEDLTEDLLLSKIKEVGPGTGHIKDGFNTVEEVYNVYKKEKNKKAKEKRQRYYEQNKHKQKPNEALKEKARQYRKEQYQKQKEKLKIWKANRKNRD